MATWKVTNQADGDSDIYDSVNNQSYLSDIHSIEELARILNGTSCLIEHIVLDRNAIIAIWEYDVVEMYRMLDE